MTLFGGMVEMFNERGYEWSECVIKSLGTAENLDAFYRMHHIHPVLRLYQFPEILEKKGLEALLQLVVNESEYSEVHTYHFLRFIHCFRKQRHSFFDYYAYGLYLREEACVYEGDGFAYLNAIINSRNDDLYSRVILDYLKT